MYIIKLHLLVNMIRTALAPYFNPVGDWGSYDSDDETPPPLSAAEVELLALKHRLATKMQDAALQFLHRCRTRRRHRQAHASRRREIALAVMQARKKQKAQPKVIERMRPKKKKTVGVAVKHVGHRVKDHRCTLVVAHDEVEALTGTDQQLVLMLDPVKNTVNQLFVDVRSIMKSDRFELQLDGRPLPRTKGRKKLHKIGAYGGGTFVLRIVTGQ
tara:strand:- start:261 stop:905 length:645 start_codon:yes stop_codon:yes gene_type:complete